MQEVEQEEEEQDSLFYDLPLPRLLAWNRWRHLTAKTVLLVYKKRTWEVMGPYLKTKKGAYTDRVVLLRTNWSARGRESSIHLTNSWSPPILHDTSALPVPRLADHLDTDNGPSEQREDGEKEAKCQTSEPTTPISTLSRLPYEYDEVMGITQVDPKGSKRV